MFLPYYFKAGAAGLGQGIDNAVSSPYPEECRGSETVARTNGEYAMGDVATLHKVKVVIEHTEDGYVAYPLGLKGVVVGQGDSYAEALKDVTSAIRAHVETFGPEAIETEPAAVDAFVAETEVRF